MRRKTIVIAIIMIFSFLLATLLVCQANDKVIYGCYKKNNGQLRIVSDNSKCLPSELPITLHGAAESGENPIPGFEGEICWSFYKTEYEGGPYPAPVEPFLLKSRVTYMGGAYFTLQGVIAFVDENPHLVGGYAVVSGDNIIETLHCSKDHAPQPWRDIDNIQVELDSSTLDGIWWGITNSFNVSTREFDKIYAAGIMELTTCQ